MSRALILTGVLLILAGVIVWALQSILGSRGGFLPGDIVIRRGSFTFFFPVVSCIVISVVLSLLFYILSGMRR